MKKSYLVTLLFLSGILFVSSCSKDSEKTSVIPADPGTPVPTTTVNNLNTAISNPAITNEGDGVISITLLGIEDPKTGTLIDLKGTGSGQTVWVEEDGVNKGILVEKVNRMKSTGGYPVDAVFIVDNSGSMSEEADSIASQISSFASFLEANGIDLRVGCVGHYGEVNGALNITTVDKLKTYLGKYTGTSRTSYFGGTETEADALETNAQNFCSNYNGDENAIPSLLFADKYFSWRPGAARFYITFTDEALQPEVGTFDLPEFQSKWKYSNGIVNSVFSLKDYYWNGAQPDTTSEHENSLEWNLTTAVRPWALARHSGGVEMYIHSDCKDLDLKKLKATSMLSQSSILKLKTTNISGKHVLKFVVKNGSSDGYRIINDVTYN
ncbi:MAG TPA: hypothetical protein VHO72_13645 [Bacteroidales bacterium]|nr:hypothetical protein [Bacteroidales bacterium]